MNKRNGIHSGAANEKRSKELHGPEHIHLWNHKIKSAAGRSAASQGISWGSTGPRSSRLPNLPQIRDRKTHERLANRRIEFRA